LAIFANQKLKYDEDISTALVHYFMFAQYFFAIVGSIISDTWLGRYRTLVYMALLYAIGTTIVGLGTVEPLNVSVKYVIILNS
jgi:solute carrier family 15 (oligopeptide transporter), member 1